MICISKFKNKKNSADLLYVANNEKIDRKEDIQNIDFHDLISNISSLVTEAFNEYNIK